MHDNSKTVIALIAGLAVGAVLGVLFAPEKGSDTRDKLSDTLKDLSNSIKDSVADQLDTLTELKDKVVSGIKSKTQPVQEETPDDMEHA